MLVDSYWLAERSKTGCSISPSPLPYQLKSAWVCLHPQHGACDSYIWEPAVGHIGSRGTVNTDNRENETTENETGKLWKPEEA